MHRLHVCVCVFFPHKSTNKEVNLFCRGKWGTGPLLFDHGTATLPKNHPSNNITVNNLKKPMGKQRPADCLATQDGSVTIPEVLRPYMMGMEATLVEEKVSHALSKDQSKQ